MLSFKLNTEFVDSYRGLPEPFGFSGLGAVAFYRTYSRQKDNGDYESWTDVCERVINGMYSIQKDHCLENNLRWSDKKAQESAKEAFDRMFNLKWSPAGRGMWMMGTKFIHEDKTSEALLNCAAISTKDIATKMGHIFEWFMEMLMLGVGVGGDTKGANTILVYKPMLEKMVVKVPDSREGWAESVKLLVDSYLHHGHVSEIEFDYSLIREKGQPIKRFGGVSSGSEPLKILHERVRSVLDKNHNSPITSRTIVDIFNAIGGCVVSGNVRRSAEIMFGEIGDEDFVKLKDYTINPERADIGWSSNNSILAEVGMNYEPYLKNMLENGEPGFVWTSNMQKYGRMGEKQEDNAILVNPCFAPGTMVQTKNGHFPIESLVGQTVEIWNGENWQEVNNFRVTATDQETVLITLQDGSEIKCTPYHTFILENGCRVAANDLMLGDKLKITDAPTTHGKELGFNIVASIEDGGVEEKVYCCTVDGNHQFSLSCGIDVGQCGEQPLANKEMCLLAEIYLNRHDDMDDFLRTIKFAYLYAKSVSLTYEWITDQESREIMCKNRRIGLSITGMAQFVAKHGVNNFVKWADTGYQYTKHYDKRYSQWLAVNESIRVTTQKPSGCRPWHSLTTTDDGIFTLEDLFQDHGENEIWANFKKDVKVYQDDGLHQITRTYNNGKSATKIIKLTYGIELTSTPNHKWYVSQRYTRGLKHRYQDVNSWVEAKDLQRGDILQIVPSIYNKTAECALEKIDSLSIKMRNDSTDIIQPEFTNPEIGWLMGYLWGDGAMSPGGYRIRFTDSRIENLQKAQNIIESQFGVSSEIKNKNREAAYTLEFGSKMLWHWLIKNGIWKYFADKLDIIPLVIRRASKETIIAFIAGLLDSDGCISATNDKCNKIIISTAHDLFADHLHHVAMAVGIVFGKSLNASGNSFQSRRHMWNLTSTPQSDPESIKTLISHSNKCKNTARDLPWQHECDFRNTKTFGRVDSVIDGEEMDTYDIEVGDGHYYYAGAIKSHNTASLLAGATPGVHHPHSQYYIRRIRIASDSNLVKILGNLGFHVEDDSYSKDTSVIEFPIYAGENIPSESDLTIWEQLEFAALTQKYWSDNAVSVTIKVNPNKTRKEEVGRALQMYEHKLKTVSFLPEVDGGAYTQMPYETITKEQYDAIVKNINFDGLNNLAQAMTPGNKLYDMYCDGNSCSLEAR